MSPEQLHEIIRLHKAWLNDEHGGVRAELRGADLRGADLHGADLREASLREANLRWANLREADLREANLRWANLREANLRGADLRGADLRGASLHGADLRGATGLPFEPDAPQRLQAVARQVLAEPEHLQMSSWHSDCGTAHCLAGWAIHQAGDLGRQLEADHGPAVAGLLLLGLDAAQHFYDSNDATLEWLRSVVEVG